MNKMSGYGGDGKDEKEDKNTFFFQAEDGIRDVRT